MLLVSLLAVSCAHVAESPVLVTLTPQVARRNGVVDLEVNFIDGPGGPQEVPKRCLSRWKVTGTAVTLDRRRQQLRIGAKAVPGEKVRLSLAAGGEPVVKEFTVRAEDEPVIVGRWYRDGDTACHLFAYVELVFDEAGRVTYTSRERMVETMSNGTQPYTWKAGDAAVASPLFAGGAAQVGIVGDVMQIKPVNGCNLRYQRTP